MNTPLSYSVTRWKDGGWQHIDDAVSPEEPVYVSWSGSSCRLWAWPDDLEPLAGWACLNGIDPAETVLFVSARITSSLYAKARRAGFSFLISRSAVTSTPVEMARQQNRLHPAHPVTVVGFCRPREERLTVFAGEGRIA